MNKSDMTPRDRVLEKFQRSANGEPVGFDPLEAKIAGAFVEDALSLEEAIESNDYHEDQDEEDGH